MNIPKIAASVTILAVLLLGANAAGANTGASGVYNPANDSSPDAMTPGYKGLAKEKAD